MEDPIKGVKQLTATELLAEDILRDRSEIVALDRRRNSNREGLRVISKDSSKSTWLTLGPLLVKFPSSSAKELLENDQHATEIEINKIRSDLKVKVNKLRDIEFEKPLLGFDLKPLDRNEMSAVGQALGHQS